MECLNILISSCLVLFGLAARASGCGDGLVSYNGACYYFSHDIENWMNADEMCKLVFSGFLLEIDNADENTFIKQEMNYRLSVTDRYWVGATDVAKEGHWVWVNSHTDVRGPGYVIFHESNSGGNENCLEIVTDALNDVACAAQRHYICEITPETQEIVG